MVRAAVPPKCLRIDDASATVTYFGYAVPGTESSEASWRIVRLTLVGSETLLQYAGGNTDTNSVWNDRLSYTYS